MSRHIIYQYFVVISDQTNFTRKSHWCPWLRDTKIYKICFVAMLWADNPIFKLNKEQAHKKCILPRKICLITSFKISVFSQIMQPDI